MIPNIYLRTCLVSTLLVVCSFAQTADALVRDGRAFLAARSISNAVQRFAGAAALQPTNETAQALFGATRLIALLDHPEVQRLLDRSAISSNGRSIYAWDASPRFDTNGYPEIDPTFSGSEPFRVLRDVVAAEVAAALTNFNSVRSPQFLLSLRESETTFGAVNVDFADARMIVAGLHFLRSSLLLAGSWNYSVTWDRIRQSLDGEPPSIEEVLREFPQLLANAAPEARPLARTELSNACAAYFEASSLIRARNPQLERLFGFVSEDLEGEDEFYANVAAIRASLEGPATLPSLPEEPVFLAPLFDPANPLRRFLPEFDGNDLVLGTWPDRTFGGINSARNKRELAAAAGQLTGFNSRGRIAAFAIRAPAIQILPGSVRITIPAIAGFVHGIERSTNLLDWEFVTAVASADQPTLVSDLRPESHSSRYYRLVDVSARVFTFGVVRDRRAFAPVPNASVCVETSLGRTICTTTDSRGSFVLDFGSPIPGYVSAILVVEAPSYGRFARSIYRQGTSMDAIEILLEAAP